MTTPLLTADPRASYLAHREAIEAAVRRVLEGGSYVLGPEVAAFEREFAEFLGVGQTVGVGSGTEALHLALRAVGVGAGDAVLTVAHTAVATVAAIDLTGAVPVLVDVEPATCTIDPGALEQAIRKHAGTLRLKAIIPVHLYGQPADLPAILQLANQYGLFVIEDCAQAHGAAHGGRKVGSWGHLAAFSFYPTKNLGAYGDGGAVATDDPRLAARVRALREYGWRQRFLSERAGFNSRLDELQAAILRVKLPFLEADNQRRRQLAALYDELLAGSAWRAPASAPRTLPVYHQYVIQGSGRDALREHLSRHGVEAGIHYPVPVHLQPGYRQKVILGGSLGHTERLCRDILSLPVQPQLSDAQVRQVAAMIREHEQSSACQGAA